MAARCVTIILATVAACELVQVAHGGCLGLFDKSTEEEKLERHLKERPKAIRVEAMMKEVEEWLEKDVGKRRLFGRDEDLVAFLEDVVSLKKAPKECSEDNLELAGRLLRSAQVNMRSAEKNTTRVAKIIFHYLQDIAYKCQDSIYQKYKEHMASLEPKLHAQVTRLAVNVARFAPHFAHVLENPRLDQLEVDEFLTSLYTMRSANYGQVLYKDLKFLMAKEQPDKAAGDHELSIAEDSELVHSLLVRYFEEPCRVFLERVPEDTFSGLFEHLDKFSQTGPGDRWREMIESWMAQQVCTRLVQQGTGGLERILLAYVGLPEELKSHMNVVPSEQGEYSDRTVYVDNYSGNSGSADLMSLLMMEELMELGEEQPQIEVVNEVSQNVGYDDAYDAGDDY